MDQPLHAPKRVVRRVRRTPTSHEAPGSEDESTGASALPAAPSNAPSTTRPRREPAAPSIRSRFENARVVSPGRLTVGFIPGVEPDTFERRWRTDQSRGEIAFVPIEAARQEDALTSGEVDMMFARLPLARAGMHSVRLWEERPVAVMGIEHELTLLEELTSSDLEGVHEFPSTQTGDEKQRIEIVASGIGVAIMPMSLARLYHRKDVTYRILADREPTAIALVWPAETDDELRQEFVAVTRGRTARSSRHHSH